MASTNNYINEYATLDEMNAAYESDHSGSWVAYCAEDNNLYYQQKTTISSKYFDNLEYNSENKTLDFYIDEKVKKSIDVSPWWFEKDSYYTREEVNNLLLPKFDNVVYDSSARTINFYSGTEVKKSIDATDFIKDGMVDNVQVVVSSDTKSYLEITFNTDSEGQKTHDTVYLDLTKIFNPENYYTKSDSDGKYVTGLGTDNKSLTYTINGNSASLSIPYATSANTTPWSGITDTPTTVQGYGITNNWLGSEGRVVDQFYGTRYYKVIEFDYYTTDFISYFGSMVFEVIGDEMNQDLWQEIHIAIRSSVPIGNVLYKSTSSLNDWYITLNDGHACIYETIYDNYTWRGGGSIKMFECNNFFNVQHHSKEYIETEPSGNTYTYKIPKLIPTYQTVS